MTEKDFIKEQAASTAAKIKKFPGEYISGMETKPLALPPQRLNLGEELFGTFELLDISGNTVHTAASLPEAKYIVYASREKAGTIPVPVKIKDIESAVLSYGKDLDLITRGLLKQYQSDFPAGKNALSAVNEIMRLLDAARF